MVNAVLNTDSFIPEQITAVRGSRTDHLLCAGVGRDGGKGENAVVESRRIVQVLKNSPKQLEKLLVVGFKGLWV